MSEIESSIKILKKCRKCLMIPIYEIIPKNNYLKIFSKCICGKKIEPNYDVSHMYEEYSKESNELKQKICLVHNKLIYGICENCEKEICEDCFKYEHFNNQQHEIKLWEDLIKKNDEIDIKNKLQNSYHYFIEQSEKMKNNIIESLKNKIILIQKNYEINKEINDKMFDITKIFFNTYQIYKNKKCISYPVIHNFLNNSFCNKFSFFTSSYSTSLDNLIRYSTYLNGNFFLKHKNIEFPLIRRLPGTGYSKIITSFLELNNGKKYVSSCSNGNINVYNENFENIFSENIHSNSITNLIKISNENFISSSRDKNIKIFEIKEKNLNILQTINIFNKEVINVIALKNDLYILTCSNDSLQIFKKNNQNIYIYHDFIKSNLSVKIEKINESLFLLINSKNIIIYELKADNEKVSFIQNKTFNLIVYIYNSQNFQVINNENFAILTYGVINIINYKTYQIITRIKCESNSGSIKVLKDNTIICTEIDKVEQFSLNTYEKLMDVKIFNFDYEYEEEYYDDYFQTDKIILFINELSNGNIVVCYRNSDVEFWKNK